MKKTKFIAAALAVLFVFNTYAFPRSNAVVIDATAAFGAAAATAAINGTTATTLFTGMSTSAVTSAMTGLMGEYAVATGAASSGTAFAASIGASAVVTAAGALVIGAAAGYALLRFIKWLREDKGLEAGGEPFVLTSADHFYLSDGSLAYVYSDIDSALAGNKYVVGETLEFSSGATLIFTPSNMTYSLLKPNGAIFTTDSYVEGLSGYNFVFEYANASGGLRNLRVVLYDGSRVYSQYGSAAQYETYLSDFGLVSSNSSLIPLSEFQPIPNEIPDTDAVVITGIEGLPQNDPQAAADAIFQTAIDGALSPTVSLESDPTVTPDPDPDPEPTTPPDDLPQNLPELGDVLISRFPFSIPWDIGRVLDFLSAEPVAPHIEYQPFKGDLFGIPADSVSVDYDFSKHEDIAAFCRTFEIVGFCLLLAVGTKRLIWTA